MYEDKLGRDTARGLRAENLLKDDLLKEAFDALEKTYTDQWRNSLPANAAEREQMYHAINAVGYVKSHLISVLNDGKVAAADLRQLAKATERYQRFT